MDKQGLLIRWLPEILHTRDFIQYNSHASIGVDNSDRLPGIGGVGALMRAGLGLELQVRPVYWTLVGRA